MEPDGAPVLGDRPVLDPAREPARSLGGLQPLLVVGMDDLVPEVGIGVPLIGCITQDRGGLIADRERLLRTVDRVEVRDRRHLLLERSEPLLRLHPSRGGLSRPSLARVAHGLDPLQLEASSFRDVDDHPAQFRLRPDGRRDELTDVPEPRLAAVLPRDAVLDVQPLAVRRLRPGVDDSVSVVRVHVLEP